MPWMTGIGRGETLDNRVFSVVFLMFFYDFSQFSLCFSIAFFTDISSLVSHSSAPVI